MPEFKKYKIGDAIELIKDGYSPSTDEHLHYIGLEHIEQQSLRLAGVGLSSNVTSNKFRFKSGDVLFGKLRPYFRKVYRPKFDGVCSTDIWVAKAKKNFDQGFIFYFMANEEFIDLSSQGSSGTRMPRADWNNLKNIEWEFPEKKSQTLIASILSSLDDKIELNRRTNQTLEQIAQTLFKKYFVDDIDPENLPEGWRLGRIGDLGKIICGKTPSKANADLFDGMIPFIKIPDMHGETYIVETNDSLTEEGANSQVNKFIPEGSICISCIATVGLVSITSLISQTNQQINSIIPQEEKLQYFTFFLMKNLSAYLKDLGSGGTATLNVNTTLFSNIEIVIPKKDILSTFQKEVEPMMKLILNNQNQMKQLAKIRDSLLPKLMSGEIEVNAIEKELAEA